MATDTFDISVASARFKGGRKELTVILLVNGVQSGSTTYYAECVVDTLVETRITRGLTAKPATASSGGFTDAVGQHPSRSGWQPRWPDCNGSYTTQRAYRENEAGFWVLEETTETRTPSFSYS